MARPAWYYQRQAEYAQARETYYRNRQPSTTTTVIPRPTTKLGYRCLILRVGTSIPIIRLPCSDASITFFGQARLNLSETISTADSQRLIPKPYGFKPSMVRAMRGTGQPRAERAFGGTGRRMIRYTPEGIDESPQQAYYSAPIADDGESPTIAGLQSVFTGLSTALRTELGQYGRINLELERVSTSA